MRVADELGPRGIERIASEIALVYRPFPSARFRKVATSGIHKLGLFARATHVAGALQACLPSRFHSATGVVVEASGPPRLDPGYGPMENFRFLAYTRFVSLHGARHLDHSLVVLRELTRRFTAEFDLRPFLLTDEEGTLRRLRQWASHEDLHVRRLVSEGTRTRLPWATHLRAFQRTPSKVIQLIDQLRTDPVRYVQISVANSLADLIKDDESYGLSTAERWFATGHPITLKIVHHAVRLPAKCGCERAKALRLGAI